MKVDSDTFKIQMNLFYGEVYNDNHKFMFMMFDKLVS